MTTLLQELKVMFSVEYYSTRLANEMIPLWQAHYEEIAVYKDIPLAPDLDMYERLDREGKLRIFTIRDADRRLCGYQIFFVLAHPHYKTTVMASQDILFLSKPLRRGLTGYKFIRWCDEQLRGEKLKFVFQHVKRSHNFGSLLKRLGYTEHDVIWSRRLN